MTSDPHAARHTNLSASLASTQPANVSSQVFCVIGVLFLMLSASAATFVINDKHSEQVVRLLSLCGMGALIGLLFFWKNMRSLARQRTMLLSEIAPSAPSTNESNQAQLLLIENQLEHAPIALFSVVEAGDAKKVSAMNGNARRLIAPGRASNPQQLFAQLGEQFGMPSSVTGHTQTMGKRNVILFETEQGIERALLASSNMTVNGVSHSMIALMPMETELQLEAQNAWLKLIHVLTHEIMNSLTPVTSLSRTASDLLIENKENLPVLDFQDLSLALDAISRRARGLADFVSSYRSLSNLPVANPEQVNIENLFARLSALVAPAWSARGGSVNFICEPSSLELMVDASQFEQVLINLMKNAAEATADTPNPTLTLHAKLTRGGRLRLEISDNGPGVPEDLVGQIFTPFFSTKEKGSGIGLALVRQLIQGNGGTVRYAHRVQGGAQFILTI